MLALSICSLVQMGCNTHFCTSGLFKLRMRSRKHSGSIETFSHRSSLFVNKGYFLVPNLGQNILMEPNRDQ